MEENIVNNNFIHEYTIFLEMYDNALKILFNVVQNTQCYSPKERIDYIRKTYNKAFLKSFYIIGNISNDIAMLINSTTLDLKISMDSLLKNLIEHPEISFKEYQNLQHYLESAEYILLKNNKNIIYFKIQNKIYQFVVKSTANGLENFITTFHKSGIRQLQKDMKRYKQIKR